MPAQTTIQPGLLREKGYVFISFMRCRAFLIRKRKFAVRAQVTSLFVLCLYHQARHNATVQYRQEEKNPLDYYTFVQYFLTLV
jgi:hypothetical protein